jgi:serine/threonine-protein kinase
MEQLEGRSLATILESAENQKIELTLAMDIVVRICAALEFAHERGVVHGDVKPANIVITPAGEPK